jgi:hypothetical protein
MKADGYTRKTKRKNFNDRNVKMKQKSGCKSKLIKTNATALPQEKAGIWDVSGPDATQMHATVRHPGEVAVGGVYTDDGTSVYSQCTAHSYKHGTFGKCVVLGDINGTFYF